MWAEPATGCIHDGTDDCDPACYASCYTPDYTHASGYTTDDSDDCAANQSTCDTACFNAQYATDPAHCCHHAGEPFVR